MRQKNRYLTVIKNKTGWEEYDVGVEDSENMITHIMGEEEFTELWNSNFFAAINGKCDLLIDDFESEILKPDAIEYGLKLFEDYPGLIRKEMYAAMKEAKEYNIALCFDF